MTIQRKDNRQIYLLALSLFLECENPEIIILKMIFFFFNYGLEPAYLIKSINEKLQDTYKLFLPELPGEHFICLIHYLCMIKAIRKVIL